MDIKKALVSGYYDEDSKEDYIVEIDENILKEWIRQKGLDLLDYPIHIEKKIAIYNILEKELTKELEKYQNFTVKFV